MWNYIVRRTLYNIPVFLSIIFVVMIALRVNDPVSAQLGKNASQEQIDLLTQEYGLDQPFYEQYARFIGKLFTLNFDERSWDQGFPVGEMIINAIPPSMAVTIPTLTITATIAICVGLVSAFFRGRAIDRSLMFIAVIGMSISVLVYIIIGQYWGAFLPSTQYEDWPFQVTVDASAGSSWYFFFKPVNWVSFCMLPVLINVTVALGYDTRFYRAVMVEESQRDYIRTARAKGASTRRVMFVHMLKNAMIPIITRIMISLPFVITGSILIEVYFGIPGMGRTLINAINAKDFPVIQTFTALFAALFIVSNILTDVLYALADPRVRLS
ncbi:MAG: peptide ABC transporter permease [Phycisphaerae bacterium]|nr:peptide ABC transporter permease [Phycisphaerae bacterium]MBM92069.1 peptide ABC transporter permease [Phycisphaerae bacterium]HCT46332.1 ABC transporter permease [Phycisphaerales bacterium]